MTHLWSTQFLLHTLHTKIVKTSFCILFIAENNYQHCTDTEYTLLNPECTQLYILTFTKQSWKCKRSKEAPMRGSF